MVVGWVMRVLSFDRRVCVASRAAREIVQADDVRIQLFRSGMNLAALATRDHMPCQELYDIVHRACIHQNKRNVKAAYSIIIIRKNIHRPENQGINLDTSCPTKQALNQPCPSLPQ